MLAPLLLIAALAGTGVSQPPVQDESAGAQQFTELRAWLACVRAHEPGRRDDSLATLNLMPDAHLAQAVRDLGELARFVARAHARFERTGLRSNFSDQGRIIRMEDAEALLGLSAEDARTGNIHALVRRAVVMHTDAATLLEDVRDWTGPDTGLRAGRTSLLVMDGEMRGVGRRGPHWEFARTLLETGPRTPETDAFARGWYAAAAEYLRSRTWLSELQPHIKRALSLLPNDPGVLFQAALAHETMASRQVQSALANLATRLPSGFKPAIASRESHLRQARGFFERVVALDPGRLSARVRLGGVLTALEEYDDAVTVLTPAAPPGADRELQYLHALFLGAAEAGRKRDDPARAAFERAAALYARAQSPRLALAGLARTAGERTAARGALAQVLARPPHDDADDDPWWSYYRPPEEEGTAALDAWRAAAVEGAR